MNRREFLAAAAVAPFVATAPAVVEILPSLEPFDATCTWTVSGLYTGGWSLKRVATVVLHCSYESGELKHRRGPRVPGGDTLKLTYDYSNDEVVGLTETLYEGPVADDFDEELLFEALWGFAADRAAVVKAAADFTSRVFWSPTYRATVTAFGDPPRDNEIGLALSRRGLLERSPPCDLGPACE